MRFGIVLLATTTGCRSLFGFDDVSLEAPPIEDAPVIIDACVDGDGDGVCDVADLCAGHDDAADADGDGIPDGCDTWPCGPEPAAPAPSVTDLLVENGKTQEIIVSNTTLAAQGTRIIVTPGQMFSLTASFSIVDCICPDCLDQIQIGLVPGTTRVCLFDGNPQTATAACATPTTGTATRQLVAPTAPGQYVVGFRLGQDFACGTTWFFDQLPVPENTVAFVCVAP